MRFYRWRFSGCGTASPLAPLKRALIRSRYCLECEESPGKLANQKLANPIVVAGAKGESTYGFSTTSELWDQDSAATHHL